jgi:hypothetical protein
MKKISLIAFLSVFTTGVFSQGHSNHDHMPTLAMHTAFTAGAVSSDMNFTSNYNFSQVNSKPGFTIGGMVRLDYLYEYFEFDLGVSYTRSGAVAKNNELFYEPIEQDAAYTRNYTLNYIDIPITMSITPTPWNVKRLYLGGGVIFAIGYSGNLKETWESSLFTKAYTEVTDIVWDDPIESHLNVMDLLYTAHAGYRFSQKGEVRLSYRQSLFNIDPHDVSIKNQMFIISYIRLFEPTYTRRIEVSNKKLRRMAPRA